MTDDVRGSTLDLLRGELESATAAKKCHRCGCFHDAVAALEVTALKTPLTGVIDRARRSLEERRYDCLGCKVCWPADALNRASQMTDLPASAGCSVDVPERREGWPPYPGEYQTIRYAAPVAVCTLHTHRLVEELAQSAPEGLCIVGSLQTENLGIERVIENVIANSHIRILLVCGEDTPGRIGHFPGQSLISLVKDGIDEQARIIGAAGKRPVLQNIGADFVAHFRRQVRVVDHRGLVDVNAILERVQEVAVSAPGPIDGVLTAARAVRILQARTLEPLVLDPAGYVVVVPDRRRRLLVAEHYENRGVLTTVVEGHTGMEIVATMLREGLVTRADHAAYLGREFTKAQRALDEGSSYIQDRAPDHSAGDPATVCDKGCGCSSAGVTTQTSETMTGSDEQPEVLHKVLAVRQLTTAVFLLRVERGGVPATAGQSALLGLPDQSARREYSLYSGQDDPYLEFLIEEVEGGQVSPALKRLHPGDHLIVGRFSGEFIIGRQGARENRCLMIATGVGIAPFHSFVLSDPDLDYRIIHGVRYLKDRYGIDDFERSRYQACVSREGGGDFHGRVTEYLEARPVEPGTRCFICGNADMVWKVHDLLSDKGIARDHLVTDIFY